MTSRVVLNGDGHKYPGGLREIVISCDQMECNRSLNDREIKAGGSLKEMGWQAVFIAPAMRHYCPEHKR